MCSCAYVFVCLRLCWWFSIRGLPRVRVLAVCARAEASCVVLLIPRPRCAFLYASISVHPPSASPECRARVEGSGIAREAGGAARGAAGARGEEGGRPPR